MQPLINESPPLPPPRLRETRKQNRLQTKQLYSMRKLRRPPVNRACSESKGLAFTMKFLGRVDPLKTKEGPGEADMFEGGFSGAPCSYFPPSGALSHLSCHSPSRLDDSKASGQSPNIFLTLTCSKPKMTKVREVTGPILPVSKSLPSGGFWLEITQVSAFDPRNGIQIMTS